MSAVVAAIAGAAVVGAGASVYAANKSASATQNATNAAISQQQNALSQQAQLSAPYRGLGESAIPTLSSLLGLGTGPNTGSGTSSSAAALSTLRQMPGYQFAQQEGQQNTVNQASAMGLGLSGNTLQGLGSFNQGLADSTYQQEVGNLENTVGIGQAAASGQAANIGNAANNTSNLLVNQGNTTAGIDANLAAGLGKIAGNTSNQLITQNTLAGLNSDSSIPDIVAGPSGANNADMSGGQMWM